MQEKLKKYLVVFAAFLTLSLALVSFASAAGSITLNQTSQAAGGTVTVTGSGFGAIKSVTFGLGNEVTASESNLAFTGSGMGPYGGRLASYPVKPGTFVLTSDTTASAGQISTYTDNGDGTLSGSFAGATGTINYATGEWSRTSTVDLTGLTQVYSATFTKYQFNCTATASATTTSAGAFTATITVPAVAAGTYTVTAVDNAGNKGTATLTVGGTIPENIPIGVVMLAATIASIACAMYLRKRKI